jgi:hypothetical protein
MARIRAIINDKPLRERIAKYERMFEKKSMVTTERVGLYGLLKIRAEMPKDSGESRKSLGMVVTSNSVNKKTVELIQETIPHPEKQWNGVWFNLPLWMFESDRALSHFKTGNIQAMREVPDEILEKLKVDIRRDLAEQWRLSK